MRERISWQRNPVLWFAARINIYTIALSALWTPLDAVVLQQRVSDTAPYVLRDTALGIVSFVGIGLAAVMQPIAGHISDRAPLPDRRRPFIVGATAFDLPFLLFFWWAPSYAWLFAAYLLLQVSSNFAQASFQALIPDLVRPVHYGLASGIKNGYDLVGSVIGLAGVGLLLGLGVGQDAALAFLAGVLVVGAALTIVWVPPVRPLPPEQRARSLWDLLDLRSLPEAFKIDLHAHRAFALAVAVRFLFLLGLYPVQRFLLYFVQDRFGLQGAVEATSFYVLGILLMAGLAAAGAGLLSDRFGRLNTLRLGITISVAGVLGLAFSPSIVVLIGTGAVLAIGIGTFQAVNWALLSDHIPGGQGARFFGLANIATAGASALAGLLGPLISLLNSLTPVDSYQIAFGIAAAVALSSLLPLQRIEDGRRGRGG